MSYAANENSDLLFDLNLLIHRAIRVKHRYLVILSGDSRWLDVQIQKILTAKSLSSPAWLGTPVPDGVRNLNNCRPEHLVGMEFSNIVYDARENFSVDLFGALIGTIRAGGLCLLLIPPFNEWPSIYAKKHGAHRSAFVERFLRCAREEKGVFVLEQGGVLQIPPALEVPAAPDVPSGECVTEDQQRAVEAIMHVVNGHRRRPLVLVSDRGRGKSSALGIAAARLADAGVEDIIITAPRFEAAETVFHHAQRMMPELSRDGNSLSATGFRLRFLAPDELIARPQATRLLLVDEAAAIPVPMLLAMLQHHARIVFSTTVHGYEGTGRGFAVRFMNYLNELTPHWKRLELVSPIRWQVGDPLERFSFRALLMDAEPARVGKAETFDTSLYEYSILDRKALLASESDLTNVFGLFVLAHYRTRPSDLQMLMDEELAFFVCRYEGSIIAAAVVRKESVLEQETAEKIYLGQRRPPGDIIQQTLLAFCGLMSAIDYRYARIMRIAVLPTVRNRGIGTELIRRAQNWAQTGGMHFIGASFAASAEITRFWVASGFKPVHLGLTRDHGTGAHAILMLQALDPAGKEFLDLALTKFRKVLLFLLSQPLRDLDPELVAVVIQAVDHQAAQWSPTTEDLCDLHGYVYASRGYEMTLPLVLDLLLLSMTDLTVWSQLGSDKRKLLIRKILQQYTWDELVSELKLSGRQQAQKMLRQAVGSLLTVLR